MDQNAIQAQQMNPGDYVAIVVRRKWSLILPFLIVFLIAGSDRIFTALHLHIQLHHFDRGAADTR